METERLYYIDAYTKEFDAKVLSCIEEKGLYKLVLDKTAFYPEGGGQPADKGIITYNNIKVNVLDVKDKKTHIEHTIDAPIEVGTIIHGTIDWNRRYDLMQQHTGDHMISGTILSMFGFNNIGFHLNDKDMFLDYDGVLSDEDVKNVIQKCNEYILDGRNIKAYYPENINEIKYRSKIELTGDIRIVDIDGVDVCACCGTHLKTTSEVGLIYIDSKEPNTGGTRLHVVCGYRALEMLDKRNNDVKEICKLLSSPIDEPVNFVQKRLDEINNFKVQINAFKNEIMNMILSNTKESDLNITLVSNFESRDMFEFATELNKICKTVILVSDKKICIMSNTVDTNKLGKFISVTLGGKGGGKPGMYQGVIEKETSKENLNNLYNEFLNN